MQNDGFAASSVGWRKLARTAAPNEPRSRRVRDRLGEIGRNGDGTERCGKGRMASPHLVVAALVHPYNRRCTGSGAAMQVDAAIFKRPTTSAAWSGARSTARRRTSWAARSGTEALRLGEKAAAVGRDGACPAPAPPRSCAAGVDRRERHRHRRRDDADAVLRRGDARRAWLHERHPGHRQPQPEGLQRLQDGPAGRDLRRGDPGLRRRIAAEDYAQAAAAARRRDGRRRRVRDASPATATRAADEDRRRLR